VSYDRDLRTARRWAVALGVVNLIIFGLHAYQRNWSIAVGAATWMLCCWLWRKITASQQKTRDIGRVIEAGLHAMRREIETGEY
jgi:hypothetical protein